MESVFEFEEYIPRKGGNLTTEPAVSISKIGRISFNTPATALLRGCDYIALYFDAKNRVIGIKPLENQGRNTYKLANQPRSKAKFSTAGGFLKHFEIKPDNKSETHIAKWDEKLEMIIIRLGNDND